LRGGRSKNKSSISTVLTDKVTASISSALTDKFADFDKKLGAIEDKIAPMHDTLADMTVRQHEEIQRLRCERDEPRLHTIVARGKLGEIRRRIEGHSEARYLGLLDDISSEPSEEADGTSDESDINSGFDSGVDAGDDAPATHQIDEMSSAPGLSFLTRCDTRRVRAVSKTHARSVLQARLSH
jgi:hypothetical protein